MPTPDPKSAPAPLPIPVSATAIDTNDTGNDAMHDAAPLIPAAAGAGGSAAAPRERGGRAGPEPTRFGDWEKNGRCIDF